MLIGLMSRIGIFYYWTWYIWPFVFVFSFANGLATIKEEKAVKGSLMAAGVSLLIILAGITGPNFPL